MSWKRAGNTQYDNYTRNNEMSHNERRGRPQTLHEQLGFEVQTMKSTYCILGRDTA